MRIPKKLKQELFIKHKPSVVDLKYKLFSIALFHCINGVMDEDRKTVICQEYEGKERFLKAELFKLFGKYCMEIYPKNIQFGRITKESPAHKLAIAVFRGIETPNTTLSKEQIERFLK